MFDVPIPARALSMEGTQVQEDGLPPIRANRASNIQSGFPAFVKDRTPKGRCAIVGFGPSLTDTWERLKDFDVIWTVSKAHDFLLQRGIVPKYHMDLDPREHKVAFVAKPDARVQYFLATHIHPLYVDKIKAAGLTAKLFHVGIVKDERLDPRYPVHKPRFDAGVQAAELAFLLGYNEQHWFGIDYTRVGGQTHAGFHGGITSENCSVDVDGRLFGCTQLFFHGLLLAEEFLCDRGAVVRCTIHGDGLLGHFLKARGRTRFTLSA